MRKGGIVMSQREWQRYHLLEMVIEMKMTSSGDVA